MKTNWQALKNGCLTLASLALAASPLLAQTQEPAGANAAIISISSRLGSWPVLVPVSP